MEAETNGPSTPVPARGALENPRLASPSSTKPHAFEIGQPLFYRKRRPLYPGGPWVSQVGFGTYRVGENQAPDEKEALKMALENGVNLIDTSPSFGNGHAQKFVGGVLKEWGAPRSKWVVVGKVGYATGSSLEWVPTFGEKTFFFSNLLTYCLENTFLKNQIVSSCQELGIEALDCVLLQSPESILKYYEADGWDVAKCRNTFYSLLTSVFGFIEELVQQGLVGCYGISSQGFGLGPESTTALSVEKCLAAAVEAGGQNHHFKVIQCPLNWIEPEASLCADGSGKHSAIYAAQKLGIGVLVNRPFNAMANNALLRLTRPQERWRHQGPYPEAWDNWHTLAMDLEHIARQNLGQVGFEDAPLSQLVLGSLVTVPGVSAVLTGMRRVAYVKDALDAMVLPSMVNSREFLANIYNNLEFHT